MFRIAGESDIPILVELMSEFYAESSYSLDRKWAAESFAGLLRGEGRGAAWLALRDSKPAGYIVLTTRHSMEFGGLDGFVDDFFVRPAFRRKGVGKSLLEALFAECRRRDVLAVHVEVGSDNAPARGLYRAFGMIPNGRELLTAQVPKEAA